MSAIGIEMNPYAKLSGADYNLPQMQEIEMDDGATAVSAGTTAASTAFTSASVSGASASAPGGSVSVSGSPAGLAINTTASAEFCTLSIEETEQRLATNRDTGLSSIDEVATRRATHGTNEIGSDDDDDDDSLFKKFLECFVEDRLILLLIGSAVVSAIMGNFSDAISITAAIVFVVAVGFIQEYKSEQSIAALSKLVPAQCHLVRCGKEAHVLASTLVPGDVVAFRIGDRVPADIRLTQAVDLCIDESSLTGETEPVHKGTQAVPAQPVVPISARTSIAYMGTLVKEGHGRGIVVSTGSDTSFGAVCKMMSSVEKPKTPLQLAMDKLGKELSLFSFVVIGFICLIGVIQGRSWLEMFQISVSLAVAAIPEGLPIIVTVTLALGVLRMAKRKAIVRRLPSVETLGSVNVICTDKTGTLTENHMTAAQLWCLGTMKSKENVLKLRSGTANNGHLRNYLTDDVRETLQIGTLCNNAVFSEDHAKFLGNPTDVAILEELPFFDLHDIRAQYNKVAEIPFNSSRKFMAVRLTADQDHQTRVCVKGAFEVILERSTSYITESGKLTNLTDSDRSTIIECANAMACDGLRVLAFAQKIEDDQSTSNDQFTENDISNLSFAGLIGMSDPPRATVKPAIEQLLQGGVHIIMITGDSPNTAISIAREIGIPVTDTELNVMTGEKLKTMSNEQLSNVIKNVNIFARATPEDKLNIVNALKERGDVVAMTGDGVNDAPALKLADIGVSMGIIGTDVAKEASDMILTDDDFSTILTAVEEGKGIFNNIQNFLTFQLSTSIAALSLIALSTAFKLPNPLNPMQILWINILMDGPPAQSLGVEAVDHEVMKKPPRSRTERILNKAVLGRLIGTAICIIIGTTFIFIRGLSPEGEITSRDTTMTFTCFVFFDLFNALACRHATKSVFTIGIFSNNMFNLAVGLSLIGQLCVIYVPLFQHVFKTERLSGWDLLMLLGISSTVLLVDEIRKFVVRRLYPSDDEEASRYENQV
ncbi:Ca(2+)/Mn(2+)-transporting P-type ATPase [Maudiozyma humilis]|uniref:Calcium-transporting ATPase n=1 Tax=Maudiozyma humilis TaxID=51915 RepID=A0AAV5RRN0_MAUHU|nr:Ca(2+)/Mn(2+)-transporting P-type ATPase [Kazachstania humilis]